MIHSHEIRHHSDGSIDFDFYRTQAATLRGHAMRDAFKFKRDAFKLKSAFGFTLITLIVIAGATIIATAPAHWV